MPDFILKSGDTFTAEDTYSEATKFETSRPVDVSIIGNSWSGTVTLQRKPESESTWRDVDSWPSGVDCEGQFEVGNSHFEYRIGVKSGEHSGTSVVAELTQ
jgi:hypothetical protein|tara:strand:- start:1050 stop:1352 length:303 start_codon:yes stop_codon:yes gene_type:complete